MIRSVARNLGLGRVKRGIQSRVRKARLRSAIRYYQALPADAPVPVPLLDRIVGLWANEYSAKSEYLDAILRHLPQTRGSVLECGSGLTTILVGHRCQQLGRTLYALEHHSFWANHVREYLDRGRIESVRLVVSPIGDLGDFDWYHVPEDSIPDEIGMVICDGPPGGTRGGRYGLLPLMRDRMSPDCLILMDDSSRPGEREVMDRWSREYRTSHEEFGVEKPYSVVKLGEPNPPSGMTARSDP